MIKKWKFLKISGHILVPWLPTWFSVFQVQRCITADDLSCLKWHLWYSLPCFPLWTYWPVCRSGMGSFICLEILEDMLEQTVDTQHRVGRGTTGIAFGFVLMIISILCFGSHLKMNLCDFYRKKVIQREHSQRLYFFHSCSAHLWTYNLSNISALNSIQSTHYIEFYIC